MAEDDRAQWPHQKPGGKGPKRCDQAGDRVIRRKKDMSDFIGEKTIDGKVIPFKDVTDGAGDDKPLMMCFKIGKRA